MLTPKSLVRFTSHWLVKLGIIMTVFSLTDNLLVEIESAKAESPLPSSPIPELSNPNSEVIKVKIQENNDNSEWIRIEQKENRVTLLHTRNAKSGFSELTSIIQFIPSFYVWYDHPVSKAMFKPDNCSVAAEQLSMTPSSCTFYEASNTLSLPEDTNIRQGQFTIEYTESGILRTVSFRIPE